MARIHTTEHAQLRPAVGREQEEPRQQPGRSGAPRSTRVAIQVREDGGHRQGELIGVGSLQLEQARAEGRNEHLNMVVPIDLLKPILDDMLTLGRPNRPPRPWLGLYAAEVENRLVVAGLANKGPAQKADLRIGDLVVAVGGKEVGGLAPMFRSIWALGNAGVEVPLTLHRDGVTFDVRVNSSDRNKFYRAPRMH